MREQIIQEALQQLKTIAEGVNDPWIVIITSSGVLVALLLGVVGIFQDRIRACFIKPDLKVSIKLESPDCHKMAVTNTATGQHIYDSYYFRFRVENAGNHHMEDVEAMVTELYKKSIDGYKKLDNFIPLNLVWAHYKGKITEPKIQPRLFKHLDFGNILKSQFVDLNYFGITQTATIVFQLALSVFPNSGSHILLPGEYKVKVVFAANNLKPEEKIYHLNIKDKWSDDERTMLVNNVSINEEA